MTKSHPSASFKQQMRQSMDDLRSIMSRAQSPGGNGRFTVRTVEIIEPGLHDARSICQMRRSLNLSQALFAQLLGVSGSLVRAWELGTRNPTRLARRLLDQVRAEPRRFSTLVRESTRDNFHTTRPTTNLRTTRPRKVA